MTAERTNTVAGSSAAACSRLSTLTAPDLNHLRGGEASELTTGEVVEDLELAEMDLSGGDLSTPTLLGYRFSGIFTNDTDLATARLVNCRLGRLSATYLHSPRSTWCTVKLVSSHIGAWELCDADVESLLMGDCRLGFANLAGTAVCDLLIRATQIDELDPSGIDAQWVRFEDCQVSTLHLHDGSLSGVDLRGLEVRIVSGVGSLAGATISSGQLSRLTSLLAQHLGLRVTDQDHARDAATRSRRV